MDQRTRRHYNRTIEKFFPSELCDSLDGYPNLGINSDFVCGELSDAVDAGEHVVRCVQMPSIQTICERRTHGGPEKRRQLYMGFWVMLSTTGRIIIFFPGKWELQERRMWSSSSDPSPRWIVPPLYKIQWIFHSFSFPYLYENVDRVIDLKTKEYIAKYTKKEFVQSVYPGAPIKTAWTIDLPYSQGDCASTPQLIDMIGYQSFLDSCESLLRLINTTTPDQQRDIRQRQRLVEQSSNRIGRSLTKIREEFGRLETELKKLGQSAHSIQRKRPQEQKISAGSSRGGGSAQRSLAQGDITPQYTPL